MRVLGSKKKWTAATFFGVAVIGTLAAVALASPGTGFVGQTPLVTAKLNHTVQVNHDRVKFQTKDPTDVRVQQFVIAPGGFSGWHHHPGMVIVAVATGSVTVTESDCSSETYGPGLPNGSVFVEGADDPMQAANASASVGATVYATFIAPRADPPVFRIEDDPISCP